MEANFFGLGGNSLKSIRLVSRLNQEFGAGISIAKLFKTPSIAGLARQLLAGDGAEQPITEYRPTDPAEQVLSYSQERLWFVDQYERGTNAYNIGLTYALADGVDLKALECSLRSVYVRHEPLRTLIKYGHSGGYQLVLDADSHALEICHRTVANEQQLDAALAHDIEEVFNLADEIPFRVRLYDLGTRMYLGFVIHHVAFDGWSVEVMLTELEEFYKFHSHQSPATNVPLLPIQYRDFAAWERGRLSGEVAARAVAYWKGRLQGANR